MFQLILCQKSAEHCKEQHEKLPEIMCPFFSCCMCVCMYFHNFLLFYMILFIKVVHNINSFRSYSFRFFIYKAAYLAYLFSVLKYLFMMILSSVMNKSPSVNIPSF